ncbi:MAG: hypothetical protein DHS20C14_00700 [Phycisphaeraceae bacterium]|nr:MAG: hypothetical protein DHS20C14_00700 [Phycisphaeraceae bacterium]
MTDPTDPTGAEGAPAPSGPIDSGRTTSVRLRDAQAPAGANLVGDRMDAANQSLGDALRITFRLVQLGMIVLVLLFIFSGFRAIQEGERGIATFFGRPVQTNIEPGFHPAWPYPVGEVITIGTGTSELEIKRAFFPYVNEGQEDMPESRLSSRRSLDPARDGSLITADQNIAHAQWTLNYRRSSPLEYAQTIPPELEREIVSRVAGAAIVEAIAQTTIDDLLKDPGQDGVAARALSIAQAELDEMGSGIRIDQFVLYRKFPPVNLLDRFNRVQSAVSIAGEARVNARTGSDRLLNTVAGPAAPVLIEQINEYERAVELGETAEAAQILARIDAILLGEPVEIDGELVRADVSGEVAEILSNARQSALAVTSRAQQDASRFNALREQYAANAPLMLTQQWTLAMATFLDRPEVQTFLVPEGAEDSVQIRLNPDPDIIRQMDIAKNLSEVQKAAEQRQREQEAASYNTQRGVIRGDSAN